MSLPVGFRALPIVALSAMLALIGSGSAVGGAVDDDPAGDVRYVAPSGDFPARRIGAGIRGMGRFGTIQILAPDHLGYTVSDQPTLLWYLAEPTTTRIEFTLRDETSVEPLVEVVLSAPAQPGIQVVRLSDLGARLAAGKRYLWFVSLVADAEQRSKDFTSGAWIAQRTPDDAVRGRLAAAGANEASVYAQNGYWYDAIGALSARIAAKSTDAELRAQRAALLEQAGLSEVAAYDREQAAAR
jgi:Domain of Unknown Function (DUF928)